MRKLRKNKFLVLTICVIVVSMVYFGIQKAIDNYAFKTNSDIVSEGEGNSAIENTEDSEEGTSVETYSEEEIDLELEEEVTSEAGQVASGEGTTVGDAGNMEDGGGVQNSDETFIEEKKIYVYITGEVNNPGVVILNEGSRIVDAINAAGGTTIKANVSKVNLVYVLDDGMKVNIPNDNDLKNNPDFEYITMNSGDGGKDDYVANNDESVATETTNSASSNRYSIVNINTATQTELETLPGIGPSLALKIINYRKENGKFSSIDEIKNVSGIGESKFEGLKEYITI